MFFLEENKIKTKKKSYFNLVKQVEDALFIFGLRSSNFLYE